MATSLKAIKFDRNSRSLHVLDQLLIPFQEKYLPIYSISDGYAVIKKMQVRGAPAIAIVGVLSIIVELNYLLKPQGAVVQTYYDIADVENFKNVLIQRIEYLVSSRPTAVNLSNACKDVVQIINHSSTDSPNTLLEEICKYGTKLFDDDLTNNYKIGENGAKFILDNLKQQNYTGPFSVLTICNTGSLATSGHGTALGVVRSLWELSKANKDTEPSTKKSKTNDGSAGDAWLERVFPLETRPYNQGSRLTAFELVYEKIPATLITDNMISFLLDSIANGRVNQPPVKAVIVGADRIAKNGDTANKIGTLQLAKISSLYPGILFLVAAPTTTIDPLCPDGSHIVVEERPADELRKVKGGIRDGDSYKIINIDVAPNEIDVWNPSFDVTGHVLIHGIVTENGVLTKTDGQFSI
ncbi:S-methyl-5-thioribose-1-phosphate isomerase [Saccharomycopsis crataegensis]|uniref:Methylthioribose-1-phosphate isomerase n=1 Tax=Saccharomycopsis crataegensis TaxID=43959 RepID=A0AAV5QKM9_9ASCO|nr:S-methyl-5-thioribose-1-phosphate isomerase [Saccharomycopsis crataegensis]